MEPALRFLEVSCIRDGVEVLSRISLESNSKRIGVVGRNGSGKSSLARLLVGLAEPTDGTVRIFGEDVAVNRAFALTHVGIIFQNPDQQIIFPTVGEEIGFGLENLGYSKSEGKQRVQRILSDFGFPDWYDKPVYSLSHGQKHLVCLLSVLAMEPKLIVFDEPYSGLDIPATIHMRNLLSNLHQHVVLISHNPADFEGFDELIWLEHGRLEQHGPCDALLRDFLSRMSGKATDEVVSDGTSSC